MTEQTPFVLTIQIGDVLLQIDKHSFEAEEPTVTVYLNPTVMSGSQKGRVSLSALKAAADDVLRVWEAHKTPSEPKETTTSEENKEETN